MGILSDLLEWNKLDPVDEYEIHRNNLIYKNFQHNRNPFIDFPEWADYIWGVKVGNIINPLEDKINEGGEYVPPQNDDIQKREIPWIPIIIGVAALVVVVILIIAIPSFRKKVAKSAKKSAQKAVKKQIRSSTKKKK